jgi:glycosyltransferase involved in cell wall biosynthesis
MEPGSRLMKPAKKHEGQFNKHMIGIITRDEMLKIPANEISAIDELVGYPMVSVVMMTRNHEKFISQAIESVISQKCSFEIELLIGEDFSTDDTRAACEDYQKKYPHLIRLIVAHQNVGILPNFLRLVSRSRGKYIALLEGDDFWEHWTQSLSIVRLAFPRLIKFYPLRYMIFALGVCIQPVKAGYYRLRRKLAMRSRFSFIHHQGK